MKKLLLLLIKGYQKFISPLHKASCIYYPTCSQYALQAIERFGAFRGSILAVRRLLRCPPLSTREYYDPVLQRFPRPFKRGPADSSES